MLLSKKVADLVIPKGVGEPSAISLADFTELTLGYKLDRFQQFICEKVTEAVEQKKWLLIHAPPGVGKSVILSQRTPPWCIGRNASIRTAVQCYNRTQSQKHGAVVADIVKSHDFRRLYPNVTVPTVVGSENWATAERRQLPDGQKSWNALGLLSGLTGNHPELLIIDDPYKDSEEAKSATINDKIWDRVKGTIFTRLSPGKNTLVVMFHRYQPDDLAGRLLDTGLFEYIRLPAICDSDNDPLGREPGELLTPRLSREWLERLKEEDPYTFAGQFQGLPILEGAQLFRESDLNYISHQDVPKLAYWIRFWDLATSTKQTGDYTVGALVGVDNNNDVYIYHVNRFRKEWPDARREIEEQAIRDEAWIDQLRSDPSIVRASLVAGMESVAFQLGAVQEMQRKPIFKRFPLMELRPDRNKKERALVLASRARQGKVWIVRDHPSILNGDGSRNWNQAFVNELKTFTGEDSSSVRKDDQVDAVSGALTLLAFIEGGVRRKVNELEFTFGLNT